MSNTKLPATNEFFVCFDTVGTYLKGVKVTVQEEVLDATESARIDLADHPLYKKLQAYVLANPR